MKGMILANVTQTVSHPANSTPPRWPAWSKKCHPLTKPSRSMATVMLLIIVIHYYVVTYDHVSTKINIENAMCQRERSQSD